MSVDFRVERFSGGGDRMRRQCPFLLSIIELRVLLFSSAQCCHVLRNGLGSSPRGVWWRFRLKFSGEFLNIAMVGRSKERAPWVPGHRQAAGPGSGLRRRGHAQSPPWRGGSTARESRPQGRGRAAPPGPHQVQSARRRRPPRRRRTTARHLRNQLPVKIPCPEPLKMVWLNHHTGTPARFPQLPCPAPLPRRDGPRCRCRQPRSPPPCLGSGPPGGF
jgi:hypothetical protein